MSPPPRFPRRQAVPVADLVAAVVDPLLAKKAGMTTGLLGAWPEIAGPRLAETTRPEKLQWPARRRGGGEDAALEPAILVVACEPAAALRLQHQTGEVLARVNAFFGYRAVERIKIVQKSVTVARPSRKPAMRPLTEAERDKVARMVANVEDPKLKQALAAFAESILGRA